MADILLLPPFSTPLPNREFGDEANFTARGNAFVTEAATLVNQMNDNFIPAANDIIGNVNQIMPNLAEVVAVGENISAVSAVAPHVDVIAAVGADMDSVQAVAGSVAVVITVSQHIPAIDAAAQNMPLIQAAPGHAETASASAAAAMASETNSAANESSAANSAISAASDAAIATDAATRAEAARDRCEEIEDILTAGGTPLPTPDTPMRRNEYGRSQVADPEAEQDIANKGYVDAAGFFTGQITPYHGPMDDTGAHPLVNGEARTGWRLCDGEDGTPDLRDRFILGAGGTRSAGATGGAESVDTSTVPGHAHTGGTVGATTLTESQMPVHTHSLRRARTSSHMSGNTVNSLQGSYPTLGETLTDLNTISTGGGASHTHTASATGSAGSHSHTVDTLPPYYALCYIMKL